VAEKFRAPSLELFDVGTELQGAVSEDLDDRVDLALVVHTARFGDLVTADIAHLRSFKAPG
jgi:hypothetical protein